MIMKISLLRIKSYDYNDNKTNNSIDTVNSTYNTASTKKLIKNFGLVKLKYFS